MTNQEVFTHIDPDLFSVLEELRHREPIFHTPEFGTTLADFEKATAPEYWEVGASGRRYSREFILRTLDQNPPMHAASAGWQSYDHGLLGIPVKVNIDSGRKPNGVPERR